ncbi:MAG: zinc ribbon domain-containing protein [Candidatus Hodarchaeota archaeon]
MPRGGGGFRGGGFRGGGFGGGFRGGGFRGGGFGGRIGGGRPSGRPFGRTGANRIVSRSPSGPYRHNLYRPYRRYYRPWWWYHRPWYYRWWYSPWWAGHYYRPWYYSPMYIGGGILFIIIMALILLPIFGVAFLFPFSEADVDGYVNYRSTETLYFNEFWYEREYIEEGNGITYYVDSSPSLINFAISDSPFNSLPTKTVDISEIGPITLLNDQYEYVWMFLRPGSVIDYDFNTSGPVDFFIGDGNDVYVWDQGGSPIFYVDEPSTTAEVGSLPIFEAKDYFVVWYNSGGSSVDVDFTIVFTATGVVDFTAANFYINQTDFISEDTYYVPYSGNWYFFIYFDPMNSPEESTSITFDVTYDTGKTSVDRWFDVQWILIIILVVVIILLVAALIARRGQKKLKLKEPVESTPKVSPYKKVVKKVEEPKEEKNCIRCGAPLKPTTKFCTQCGGKIEGRKIGETSVTTPAEAKNCSLCGSKLSGTEKFCKWCGTKVEN